VRQSLLGARGLCRAPQCHVLRALQSAAPRAARRRSTRVLCSPCSEPWRPPHRRHRRCIASASAIQRGPGPLVCLRPRAWGGQDWCRRTVGALLPGPASARHVSAFCDGLHSPAPSSVHRRCIGAPARPRAPRLPPSPSLAPPLPSDPARFNAVGYRAPPWASLVTFPRPRRAAGRRAPRESF